jgi:hypothetical protein
MRCNYDQRPAAGPEAPVSLLMIAGAIPLWIFIAFDILVAVLLLSNIGLLLALRRNSK